jgi:hypothetical protein
MNGPKPDRQKDIDKRIITVQVLGAPGTIMVGLALYGILAADGNAFWEPLNNKVVTWNMLAIGLVIIAWETLQTVRLARIRKSLLNEENE